jgi:hypothetical protein
VGKKMIIPSFMIAILALNLEYNGSFLFLKKKLFSSILGYLYFLCFSLSLLSSSTIFKQVDKN